MEGIRGRECVEPSLGSRLSGHVRPRCPPILAPGSGEGTDRADDLYVLSRRETLEDLSEPLVLCTVVDWLEDDVASAVGGPLSTECQQRVKTDPLSTLEN